MAETPTVLLFGGYTEPWLEPIDRIHEQAGSCAWLQHFLEDVASVVRTETTCMHPKVRNSLGPSGIFTSVQEVADLYRNRDDHVGFVQCIMSYIVRAVILLRWVHDEPDALKISPRPEGLGISGGLINAAVLAIANDFDSLYKASVVTAGFVCRLCEVAGQVSRAVEFEQEGEERGTDGTKGSWGCAVIGSTPHQLDEVLHQIQESKNVPQVKRVRVGIRGDSWGTVIGPPSVLDMCLEHPDMSNVAKQRLPIYSMQHNYRLSQSHREYIAGSSKLHLLPIHPGFRIWGLETPTPNDGSVNWGQLLLSVVDGAFSNPVDLVEMVKGLDTRLGPDASEVQLRIVGATWFAGSLGSKLKATGRKVTVTQHDVTDQASTEAYTNDFEGRIAVVGMAGRAPECDDLEQYWQVIEQGRDLAREIPAGRFDADSLFFDGCEHSGSGSGSGSSAGSSPKCTSTCKLGCFLKNPGDYDSRFFRISPREALLTDPGSRLFQMAAHEALESAGYSCGTTRTVDPGRIGVLFGQSNVDGYETAHHEKGCDAFTLQAQARPFASARVAFHYGWEGPTYSIDQACSTSLSLLHLACGGLQARDYDMVVAGAANVLASPHGWCLLSKAGVLSDTGNCKTFRDDAQGYCRGEFVGVVVLKRLEDAVAHNDRILAVIPGSARNQAGNSTFLTASDQGAEERVLKEALRRSRLRPSDIAYAEMHGTATPVGDPCEMTAVANVLGRKLDSKDDPLTVGSVKANIGHSEASSGIASVIKSILMFQKDTMPPQVGMPHALNEQFPPLHLKKIRILSKATPFVSRKGKPRRVLINNFDAAGGNTALVVQDFKSQREGEEKKKEKKEDPRSGHTVVLSAHTATSHKANVSKLASWLRAHPDARLEDIAYTTTARRVHQTSFRFACAASSTKDLLHALESESESAVKTKPIASKSPVIFVFTGQGSHYAGMGAELYQTNPVFRDTVDLCKQICDGFGFPSFLDIITGTGTGNDTTWNTVQTQLAVVALEIGLTAFWKRLGVAPTLVMGHSLGEYAALHAAGVLSLADALYLVGSRATLAMQKCEQGAYAMLAVSAPATDVQALAAEEGLSTACVNSPRASVVSGTVAAVAQLQAKLQARQIRTKLLPLPYGFHSAQVDPILDDFKAIASGTSVKFSSPRVPVASTLLASIVDAKTPVGQGFTADYLTKHARNAVDFVGALHAVQAWATAQVKSTGSEPVWLEIGPAQVCGTFVQDTLSPPAGHIVSTLSAASTKRPWAAISECLASLYVRGCDPDWLLLHAPFERNLQLLTLPSYSWSAKDFWISYRERNYVEAASGGSIAAGQPQPILSTCAQHVVDKSTSKDGKAQVTLSASLDEPALRTMIEGHRMQDVGLCPGSVFCEAALVAAKCALEGHKGPGSVVKVDQLSLHKAHLQRPLTASLVGPEGGDLHTIAVVESDSHVLVSFKAVSRGGAARSFALGNCEVVVKVGPDSDANSDSGSFYIRARMQEVTRTCKSRLPASILYALFSRAVQYGSDNYRCIREAFVADDFSEAVAEVVPAADPSDLRVVASSPYIGEALAHIAGFLVNCHQDRLAGVTSSSSFIMDSLERFEQTPGAIEAGKTYFTYARVLEKKADTAICEVVVFDDKDRVVMRTWRMRFHEVPNAVLKGLLPTSKPSRQERVPDVQQVTASQAVLPRSSVQQQSNVEVEAEQPLDLEEDKQELVQSDSDAPKGATSLLPVILESIAEETGLSDTSELTEDASLADLGVDSIMAVEICARVKTKSGHQLFPSFILEHPTIGHLVRVFEQEKKQEQEQEQEQVQEQEPEPEPEPERPKQDDATTNNSTHSLASSMSSTPAMETPPSLSPGSDSIENPMEIETNEPPPKARIMMLQPGRRRTGTPASKARLYLVCDGTGSISNYIHLLKHQFSLPVYGIDSPYLRCPSRLTPKIGIPGVAKGMVDALISLQPKAGLDESSPLLLGGFSGGGLFCYEMCRQLAAQGRRVDGLVVLDMRSPLPPPQQPIPSDKPVWEILFTTGEDSMAGQIHGAGTESNTTKHLRTIFESVLAYHPPQRPESPVFQFPAAVIWCAKGMVRLLEARRPDLVAKLVELGYPITSYDGYMEDPRLGAMAWSIPHKTTESDLGPGGWEKFVGAGEDGAAGKNLLCLAIDTDHHGVLHPGMAKKAAELIDQGVAFCLDKKA